MTDLDFFVDVAVTGTVLGVGLADSPDAVTRVLGPDFRDDPKRVTLTRDYGLLEFFWSREHGLQPWQPFGFTVQAHRLPTVPVVDSLVHRYGQFCTRLPFAPLRAALERRGTRMEAAGDDRNYRHYRLPDSGVRIVVLASPWEDLEADDVWSIRSGPH